MNDLLAEVLVTMSYAEWCFYENDFRALICFDGRIKGSLLLTVLGDLRE